MQRKPDWLRVRLSDTKKYNSVNDVIKARQLNTVCEGANCPNRVHCYSQKTATFLILGEQCTRNCRFCNIEQGELPQADLSEPERVALGIKDLGLAHAVITSVTRDDLSDGGASVFAMTVQAIRRHSPETIIELLIPDMQGNKEAIDVVMATMPEVLNHNIETVHRLYPMVRPEADYDQSLEVLRYVKAKYPEILTKSGLMLGLGESIDEVKSVMRDLRDAQVDFITIGQYLQPSPKHYELVAYITPEVFGQLEAYGKSIGFKGIASAPLVRSSYYAKELYEALKR